MSHWPDLERCKALRDRGFPQNTICGWFSDILNDTTSTRGWNTPRAIPRGCQSGFEELICAAPIVTELIEEIRKFAKPQESELLVSVIEMYLSEDGSWNVGSIAQFQMTEEPYDGVDYCTADTLPNALADLWLWLREKEKGEKE